MKLNRFFLLVAATVLLPPGGASADLITWQNALDTTATTNVSTNGTLVAAFNAGPANGGSVTVNGVEFFNANPFQFGTGSFLGGGSTGDNSFDILLNQVSFNFNNPNPGNGVIDLGQFNIGDDYEIQVFFTDQRTNSNNRTVFFGSTDGINTGAEVGLLGDPNQLNSAPFGQHAIGTFSGDGSDPDLLVRADGVTHNSAQITAWQIRKISAVPEPSSILCLYTVGLTCLCRRKRSQR